MRTPSSLISRFAASTAVFAAAIVLLSVFAFHAIRGELIQVSFETPLDEWSSYLAGRIGEDPEIAQNAARSHEMGVLLTTRDGIYAFGPDGEPVTPEFLAENHANVRTIIVEGHGSIRYSFYLSDSVVVDTSVSLLWLWIGGLLFIVGVVYVVQLSQLRPLRWLKESVDKVSAGDLSTRVPVVRMDEVGQVARAFNHMTGRVEQMLNDHDRLMADVSHELRSPLARIKLALELLPEGDKRNQIATDIREMEALTSTLLERERIKIRTARPEHAEFDLVAMTRGVVASFDGKVPIINLCETPETLNMKADEALIKVLLHNLLDNAVKFSLPDSGPVGVRLMRGDEFVTVSIDDDGCGIPSDMTERVMEPFVKLDPSRGHRIGYGLGLNLCQRIAQAHNGSIEIKPREPRGSSVTVELPLLIQSPF